MKDYERAAHKQQEVYTQHNPFWYIMSMPANQAPPPPPPPALQAYWRNHQWMLSFFDKAPKISIFLLSPLQINSGPYSKIP